MYAKALAATVLIAFATLALAAEDAPKTPTVTLETLRDGYSATLEALHDVALTSSKLYLQLPFFPPAVKMSPNWTPQNPGPHHYRFARSGDMFGYWLYNNAHAWKTSSPSDYTICDGASTLHVTDLADRPNQKHKGRAVLTPRPVSMDVSFGTSLFFLGWHNGSTPLAALASDSAALAPKPATIDDLPCYEVSYTVDRSTTAKYFFAPDRSFLPVKVELHTREGILNRREFSSFEKLPNGTFFPRRVVETHYKPQEDKIAFQTEWKALDVTLAPPVSSDLFDTSLARIPDGYAVQDDSTGKEYVVGKEETPDIPSAKKPDEPFVQPPEPDPQTP